MSTLRLYLWERGWLLPAAMLVLALWLTAAASVQHECEKFNRPITGEVR